jgi:hypothetical protein
MAEMEGKGEVEPKRKRSTQREMAMRDARLIRALATGQSIEELAAREGISLRRARERVSAILSRTADPPAEFAQLQIRRLNEAMIVAYASLKVGDPRSIDTVIKLTREFDRYAGLAPTLAAPAPPAAPALPPPLLSLPPPPLAPLEDSGGDAERNRERVSGRTKL